MSVRKLQAEIKKFLPLKNPKQEPSTVTVDVDAEIKTAEVANENIKNSTRVEKVLRLPEPSFHIVPPSMQAAATLAQVNIEINFSRALQLPDSDILVTRFNLSVVKYFSCLASNVIFTAADFTRADDVIKHLSCCIWYFGGDCQNFAVHFQQFGEVILLQTQKNLSTLTGKQNLK